MPPCATISPPAASGRPAGPGWLADLAMLALASALLFCPLLGARPLMNPDEGRYAEIPREMAASGDFVTPRLNGVKYLEKPPLVYWLSALTFRAWGVNPFTARLWGGIFAVLGVLLTYAAARALHGRGAGIASAVVLATSLLYSVLSQVILLDMAVAVTMSGALFSFLLAVREPPGRRRLLLFLGFYACMALATLSKGLIGFLLPGAVAFTWTVLLNRWRALRPFHPFIGTAVVLAIAAPWHVLAARANPDFLWFYFVHEHFLRFATRVHGRYEPWWFFLACLPAGLFPWVVFAPSAVRRALRGGWRARRSHPEAWFLVTWIVVVVVFFSVSQSKLVPYILPVFPAAAVLIGSHVAAAWQSRAARGFRAGWAFVVIAPLFAAAVLAAAALPEAAAGGTPLAVAKWMLAGALVACAAAAASGLRRSRPRRLVGAMAATGAACLLAMILASSSIDRHSTREFARILAPRLGPDDRVFNVGLYAQDMPVYLGRLVSVVDYAGELHFGIQAEPHLTASRFLDRPAFSAQWREPATAYAVLRRPDYEQWFARSSLPHQVLGESSGMVLVVNRPPNS